MMGRLGCVGDIRRVRKIGKMGVVLARCSEQEVPAKWAGEEVWVVCEECEEEKVWVVSRRWGLWALQADWVVWGEPMISEDSSGWPVPGV
jgi:hypothetical protein